MAEASKGNAAGGFVALAVIVGIGWAVNSIDDWLHPEKAKAEAAAHQAAEAETAAKVRAYNAEHDRKAAEEYEKRVSGENLLKAEQAMAELLPATTGAQFFDVIEVRPGASNITAFCGSISVPDLSGGRVTERFVAWWSGASVESKDDYHAAWTVMCEGKPVVRTVMDFSIG